MGEFKFSRPDASGYYDDANAVRWSIWADPTDLLANEWNADTDAKSRYGVVSIFGPATSLKARIDAYAAGYAVVPPVAPTSGSSWWLLALVAAVVLMDEDRRR